MKENQNDFHVTEKFNYVSVDAAKSNPEFWKVVEAAYRENAAGVLQKIQRNRMQKKQSSSLAETTPMVIDNFQTFRSMQFFKEPCETLSSQKQAEKINAGKWSDLDFEDPEFVRNIAKACRLNLISVNKMATAKLLYDAKIQYEQKNIKQYRFDDKSGPFNLSLLRYSTNEHEANFKTKLKSLPDNENWYFTVNFSKEQEILFLYDGLMDQMIFEDKFHEILRKYLESVSKNFDVKKIATVVIETLSVLAEFSFLSDETKNKFINDFVNFNMENLGSTNDIIETNASMLAKSSFQALLQLIEVDYHHILNFFRLNPSKNVYCDTEGMNVKQNSAVFLTSILRTKLDIPIVTISPDYDVSNPFSPLLCMIIPTISALTALQEVIFGEKDTTDPAFRFSPMTTRDIRDFDEHFEKMGCKRQSRPVELTYPDVEPTKKLHGYLPLFDFKREIHDIFHVWANGANPSKGLVRYIKNIYYSERKIDMSKQIWALTDGDFYSSPFVRYSDGKIKSLHEKNIIRANHLWDILNDAGRNFWRDCDLHDDNLLLIIDMILHPLKWMSYTPGGFLVQGICSSSFEGRVKIGALSVINQKNEFDKYQSTYLKMKKIIRDDDEKWNDNQSSLERRTQTCKYYILKYRLFDHPQGSALCDSLRNELNDLLVWSRNEGLILINPACDQNEVEVEKLTTDELYNYLLAISNQHSTNRLDPNKKPKTISEQEHLPSLQESNNKQPFTWRLFIALRQMKMPNDLTLHKSSVGNKMEIVPEEEPIKPITLGFKM